MKGIYLFVAAMLFYGLFPSCSTLRWGNAGVEKYGNDKLRAEEFLSKVNGINNSLQTSKGLGKISLKNRDGRQFARIAWITAKPESLFIQLLNPLGQPAETIAYDGRCLTFLTSGNTDQPFYKIKTRHPSMEKLISIPIEARDVVTLLTGGIPVLKYHTLTVEKHKEGESYAILLKKRWLGGIVEKIAIAPDFSKAIWAEVYRSSGNLLYRVQFGDNQKIEAYRLPTRLELTSADGSNLKLEIDKYWPNVPVDDSLFVVSHPN